MRARRRTAHAWCLAGLAACAVFATAGERRDIVFDCPCTAEWVADPSGSGGTLTVSGGIRSLRATETGEIRLSYGIGTDAPAVSAGRLSPRGRLRSDWTVSLGRLPAGTVVVFDLTEAVGRGPDGEIRWHHHETLPLWPVGDADDDAGRVSYVDILTDADGDGVGDVNERLAGTSWEDAESTPGISEIDVLALYTAALLEAEGGYPYARQLHELTVAGALFEDSGTGVRLRIVGMHEAETDESGWVPEARREELMESHGADVSILIGGPCNCAGVGASVSSRWGDAEAAILAGGPGSVLVTAHELGHVMGLAHSARQGETYGAFRWSRGHYLESGGLSGAASAHGFGTVMTYGDHRLSGVFSSPAADCGGVPCGVAAEKIDGADAVDTLDLLRFQVAAHREPAPDSDGDGFVDAADALPDDPNDWFDFDGDGIGDNADPDDDNDGTPDADDPFPVDPSEWADVDLDGIGDNADTEVADPSPFRDPALRAAVEQELGKAPGDAITADEMATLTELYAGGDRIRDLTGLETATMLQRLWLPYNRISDLSPLAGLSNLASLDLGSNEVVDLSPLAGLTALADLDLGSNGVAEVSPLAGLTALERLVLAENPIDDIAALDGLERCVALILDDTGVGLDAVRALPYFHRFLELGLARLGIADIAALRDLPLESLNLARNPLSDIAALSGVTSLVWLDLADTGIGDTAPLSGLVNLVHLDLSRNAIPDIGSLGGLANMRQLHLADNRIADLTALADMGRLRLLVVDRNAVSDIAPLAGTDLYRLEAAGNRIADATPLAELDELNQVDLDHNAITDVAPFAALPELITLSLSGNGVADVSALAGHGKLRQLLLDGNSVTDLEAIGTLPNLEYLELSANRISDVAPLSSLTRLERLDLDGNAVSDIAPLVDRTIFGGENSVYAYVDLTGNPLDEAALDEHIPALKSWGVRVVFHGSGRPVEIADPTLRSVVAEAVAGGLVHVDDAAGWPIHRLRNLRLAGRGVASLAGLDAAAGLDSLYAAANRISDLSPLAALGELHGLDLRDNRIADLSPLVANTGLSEGDWLALDGNPLSEASLNEHVPALLGRGVVVDIGRIVLFLVAGGTARRFDTAGYFEAVLGAGARMEASVDDATLATATMSGGVLVLTPGTKAGTARATVTATGGGGTVQTLDFEATIQGPMRMPLVAAEGDAARQGFVRVVNRGAEAGVVRISAVDDAGSRRTGPELSLGPGETVNFNSRDLEAGNPAKGLTGGTGSGAGDWRLELRSTLDMDALAYVRTADGFLTAMHDVAALAKTGWVVPTFNPASNTEQVSSLRLGNLGDEHAVATITGVDDRGASPGGAVQVDIPANASVTLSAVELEGGSDRARGSLGDGVGKWRLAVASDGDLAVTGLLESPGGHLSNLSSGPLRPDREGVVTVGLFPSAGTRHGFVRIVNRSPEDGEVRIDAYDDLGWRYEPLALAVGAGRTVHLNSDDLELGNADKGLSGRTGRGSGDWRLQMRSPLDIEVLAYVRTPDGFLAAMHDSVARSGRRYEVATFNPGSNIRQASRLRIVNPGDRPAHVSIAGIDDAGVSPGDVVRLTVDPGAARTVSAAELEGGWYGLIGRLGDGRGKWRVSIDSEREVLVMNLLESPTGHLSNLSTTP